MEILQELNDFARTNAAALLWRLVAALATLLVTWLALRLARPTLRKAFSRNTSARARTLQPLVQALVSVTLLGAGIVLALEQLGFDLTAVIAGAGVVGLAIGFGAQTLVKDVISGFFLIFDEVLESGDWVEIDQVAGTVEEVGLRVTKIRAFDGRLWYVPNGQIQMVANTNREWMRAVVEVSLAYEQDVPRGMEVLAEVGQQWASENGDTVIEPPETQGVLRLDASSIVVRLVIKVKPGTQWATERELRLRTKAAFDREGIEIPFGRQVLYLRREEADSTTAA
ncbi:mechanosensitive ion channel family protein [Paraliomyxa miuraensis]|uniref:mechanosensitive ion channel family protein n=1 Tax=Paraliomyxa miuraensis TaxID=376150 RepID=UPI002251857E|nr:mechanosensitive ion channel family protein [Paraliomyxa miuraensis]MCX4244092.1 mechanosensitive ion channel family protein [Paraliomyxa miuraensis]